ncbi:UspA domain protein [Natrialba magadii ATCC 43099]|uniref:UspA domain protein n=1 Tax=Natrialba magadii (strain ATCC 43099 / DSM 3394 / CCM 3739 / CIP 104546 / IAM 13178 / JCM 8861 / NBRC 102185 / NCIMB 2190 / MS3) TaxID=547559 RepID=D3SUU2_NATMM|nr:universal stress protein [Natrialba magadii]ADD05350.1 UspA domain protein [Natrialba magadii ATCC 43099]ELY29332.1 UspA domain-containing protein [Natrialba magadii ATCC 43099]
MAILVAYDGSEPAQQAAEYAFRQHADDEIVLLRVVEAAEGYTGASVNYVQDALKDRQEEVSGTLREEIAELASNPDVEFRTETTIGRPDNEVVAFAEDESNDIDHIIVGSHGRAGVSRALLGSIAEKIVRRAPVPVTVVR